MINENPISGRICVIIFYFDSKEPYPILQVPFEEILGDPAPSSFGPRQLGNVTAFTLLHAMAHKGSTDFDWKLSWAILFRPIQVGRFRIVKGFVCRTISKVKPSEAISLFLDSSSMVAMHSIGELALDSRSHPPDSGWCRLGSRNSDCKSLCCSIGFGDISPAICWDGTRLVKEVSTWACPRAREVQFRVIHGPSRSQFLSWWALCDWDERGLWINDRILRGGMLYKFISRITHHVCSVNKILKIL